MYYTHIPTIHTYIETHKTQFKNLNTPIVVRTFSFLFVSFENVDGIRISPENIFNNATNTVNLTPR